MTFDRSLGALAACSIALLLAFMGPAQAMDTPDTGLSLYAAQSSAAPGETVALAFEFTVKPGWHLYWKNPGDTGLAPTLIWSGTEGVDVAPLEFPTPSTFSFAGFTNYGYLKSFTLLTEAVLPANAKDNVTLSADLEWLACDDKICVPEGGSAAVTLPVDSAPQQHPADRYFAQARALLPMDADWVGGAALDDGDVRLQYQVPFAEADIDGAVFYTETPSLVDYEAPQSVSWPAPGIVEIRVKAQADVVPETVLGVLQFTPKGDAPSQAFNVEAQSVALDALVEPAAVSKLALDISLSTAVFFALVGGLLLNLMPCVFPVLSLKALSLAQSSSKTAHAKRDGWLYTAGILSAFAVLAGVLLLLRAAGSQLGWGFQLQSPLVVAILALVMFVIGLNLIGAFEFSGRFANLGQGWLERRSGAAQSFATGVLATVVATPCTAPLMASALSFALTQPPLASMAIFMALGFGLALPFLLLSYSARLRAALPRPGAWMDSFKQLLAFPMFATMLWLLWVLSNQAGSEAMVLTLGAALLTGFALWVFQRGGPAATAMGIAALIIGAVGLKQLDYADAQGSAETQAAGRMEPAFAETFSEARLAELMRADTPVFVYFTADWCITCKANERLALNTSDVQAAFKASGIKVLKADWTRRDAKIARVLETFGRAGVPLYLYYKPGAGANPQELPQILRPSMLIDLVKDAPA
ncbi:MAG: protein-disulfide reductase DsbD domain-containing protein [Pseudomonadota bacterium]